MDIIKTYYVLKDIDTFKKSQIVKMEREEAKPYVGSGAFMLFHLAFKRGLVKLSIPKKSVKKRIKKIKR